MQITEHIHSLKIPFQVTDPSGLKIPRFVYVYLLVGEEIWLIDSGVASSQEFILDYVKKIGRKPEEISLLILTHSHPDHVGAAKAVKEMTGCSVAAHAAERTWIEDVDLQARERPVPGFKSLVGGSVKVDRALQDGEILVLRNGSSGGLKVKVIYTPGHSSGSISLWLPDERALLTADAVPIPGDMPIFDDISASATSIQKLQSVSGIGVLLSAWDGPRRDEEAYRTLDRGMEYLQRIHRAVFRAADKGTLVGPMELCRRVVEDLGLPDGMINPLVARTFLACLNAKNQENLL
jgi:hydroxyacylglutathione hydrolase